MSSLDAAAIKGQAYPNLAVVILLAIGTLLMVITSISAPILSSVKMFRLTSNVNGIRRYVDVGLWGYCVVPVRSSILIEATPGGGCSKPIVGFVLNSAVANVLQTPPLDSVLSKSHTSSLVIFPIATVITFLSCILQAKICFSRKANINTVTLVFVSSSISTLLCLISLMLQISVVAVANARVYAISDSSNESLQFSWGGTIWLTAIAIVVDLINLVFLYSMRLRLARIEAQAEQPLSSRHYSFTQATQEQENKTTDLGPPRPRPGEKSPAYS